MTQHKVLSDDSMTAMDEIARVLGQDAVILSTKKIGQKIEIIGSNDIKDILSKRGNTKINLLINNNNHKAYYSLQNNRKFDLSHYNHLKSMEYVVKITV